MVYFHKIIAKNKDSIPNDISYIKLLIEVLK